MLRMEPQASLLQALLRRDRLIVVAGLAVLTALSWLYLVWMAAAMDMGRMAEVAMPRLRSWNPIDLVLMFAMWTVMMIGMMTPSASPMILLVAAVNRRRQQDAGPLGPTGAFVAGYLAVWTAFSLVATLLQWGLEQAALLSPMMVSTSPVLGGCLLIAAGLYQWTPYKDVCLSHCRSPLGFLMHHWRKGVGGAFVMGIEHGAFCLGCCWLLMGLLFFGGVMNLLWVAGIAMLVLLEKVVPSGPLLGRMTGALLLLAGIALLARG
jgi:predicted metal-binding membrane protein